jgi:4-hydroxybenzoate polyprenyltransferase
LERPFNIIFRIPAFIAHANIFISICAASLAWYSQFLSGSNEWTDNLWITFGCTFVLYNTQQLFLAYLVVRNTAEYEKWISKNALLLALVAAAAISEIYPLMHSSRHLLLTYCTAAAISLLYFLPFSNLRGIPFLKSFIIGVVWTLICVVAPTKPIKDPDSLFFAVGQLQFITALCVLFNIKDMEHDRTAGTHTIPVLYGEKRAKWFAILLLLGYLAASVFVMPDLKGICIYGTVFLISGLFTWGSSASRHPFYYLYGVDGLILLQSILGFVLLRS